MDGTCGNIFGRANSRFGRVVWMMILGCVSTPIIRPMCMAKDAVRICSLNRVSYLQAAGPAPLRFLLPVSHPVVMVKDLPQPHSMMPEGSTPPHGSDVMSENADGDSQKDAAASSAGRNDSAASAAPAASGPTQLLLNAPVYNIQKTKQVRTQNLTNEPVTFPDLPAVVSPQMLLKFFDKPSVPETTNSTLILEPFDLRPPRPLPTPRSKASYSN